MSERTILDLTDFFCELKEEKYVIIKYINSNNYVKGMDIDILTLDLESTVKKILAIGNTYIKNGVSITVTTMDKNQHIYIDFFYNSNLDFRFDVYGRIPKYKRVSVKECLLYTIIENRRSITIKNNQEEMECIIYVPSKIDELIVRYIEYIEYYEIRPDKIKHLDYILKEIESDEESIKFLSKLHLYTKLQPIEDTKNHNYNSKFYLVRKISYNLKKIKKIGITNVPKVIVRKLFNKKK